MRRVAAFLYDQERTSISLITGAVESHCAEVVVRKFGELINDFLMSLGREFPEPSLVAFSTSAGRGQVLESGFRIGLCLNRCLRNELLLISRATLVLLTLLRGS